MCGATSAAQDQDIDTPVRSQEEVMLLTSEPFVSAEIEYRRQRATEQFQQGQPRRHRVWRRRTIKLPQPRRLSVAH